MFASFHFRHLVLVLNTIWATGSFGAGFAVSYDTAATNLCLSLLAVQSLFTQVSTDAPEIKTALNSKISIVADNRSADLRNLTTESDQFGSALAVSCSLPLIRIQTAEQPKNSARMNKQRDDLYWFYGNGSQPVLQPGMFLVQALVFTGMSAIFQFHQVEPAGVKLFAAVAGLAWLGFINRFFHYQRTTPAIESTIERRIEFSLAKEWRVEFSRKKISSPNWTLQPVLSPKSLLEVVNYLKGNLETPLNEAATFQKVEPFLTAIENAAIARPQARDVFLRSAVFYRNVGGKPEFDIYYWIEPESL